MSSFECPICGEFIADNTCKHCGFSLSSIKREELNISAKEAAEKLKNRKVILLDVRRIDEYHTANIDRAILIPMHELPERWRELDKEKEIICHCHHGIRGLAAANFLLQKGFKKIKNMEGGIDAWSLEVDSKVSRY